MIKVLYKCIDDFKGAHTQTINYTTIEFNIGLKGSFWSEAEEIWESEVQRANPLSPVK